MLRTHEPEKPRDGPPLRVTGIPSASDQNSHLRVHDGAVALHFTGHLEVVSSLRHLKQPLSNRRLPRRYHGSRSAVRRLLEDDQALRKMPFEEELLVSEGQS